MLMKVFILSTSDKPVTSMPDVGTAVVSPTLRDAMQLAVSVASDDSVNDSDFLNKIENYRIYEFESETFDNASFANYLTEGNLRSLDFQFKRSYKVSITETQNE
jgi:hypothetical protein